MISRNVKKTNDVPELQRNRLYANPQPGFL
jgi:hypothetical protein